MSLNSAMFTGVSGLMTMGNSMNVIGDNIANVNTVGYKANRANFADILANSLSNGSTVMQFGRGTYMRGISPSWAQGSVETTGNATDMAIQGAGFFVVRDSVNDATYYTRSGQFIEDENGYLVNSQGFRVQGYDKSTSSGVVQDIQVNGVQSTPAATSEFRFSVNLNASASAGTTFNTSFDVYNNLGEAVTLTYTFTKTAAQIWTYTIASSSGAVSTGGSGTLLFDSAGALTFPSSNPTVTISGFTGSGAANLSMAWTLFNVSTGASYNNLTAYASPSSTISIHQNGYPTGTLKGLSVDDYGVISGLFSNGQTTELWQLTLADFSSPWGLTRVGGTLYAESASSGQPLLSTAGSGGFGTILGSSLELSNVDLATEFVRMIQNQRGYQANSRVVTTVDDMLAEVVNLKR
ncbi:MAG: flagellar hook protein FlgE [Nitrospinota bacterium]